MATAPVAYADATICYRTDYGCLASTGYTGPRSVWGSWGSGHNCVSYAAYRLSANGAAKPWGPQIGNGIDWDEKAKSVIPRYRVDKIPTVGSIAQWNTGSAGHVAYVEEVTSTYIVVSEDAYLTNTSGYGARRRYDRSGTKFQTANFIHIKDRPYPKRGDANGDGRVNVFDLSMVLSNDGNPRPGPNYTDGDVNRDYRVDSVDMSMVLGNWTY